MIDKQKLQSKLDGKAPTKPWTAGEPKPWRPDFMRLQTTRPGFRPRWVREDRVKQLEMQGWSIANRKDYDPGEQQPGVVGSLDSTIKRNELILMEIPEERAQARAEHYEAINKRQEQDGRNRVKEAAAKLRGETGHDFRVTDEQ